MTPKGTRPDIRMNADEIAAFLVSQSRVVVVALDGNAPVGTVASARYDGGQWRITLRAGDPVADLLALDDRVCVIAEQFPTYYEIKGVAAHGRTAPDRDADGRATFALGLDDVTSFDFGKLPREGTSSGPTT
jgi:hypothetical protein